MVIAIEMEQVHLAEAQKNSQQNHHSGNGKRFGGLQRLSSMKSMKSIMHNSNNNNHNNNHNDCGKSTASSRVVPDETTICTDDGSLSLASPVRAGRRPLLQTMQSCRKLVAGMPRRLSLDAGSMHRALNGGSGHGMTAEQRASRDLLRKVRAALRTLEREEQELQKGLTVHIDRAKARYATGNSRGAILSMKRVRKMRNEHANAMAAIGFLRAVEMGVDAQTDSAATSASTAAPDLSQFEQFEDTVDKILARRGEESFACPKEFCNSDEDLLAELTESL